MKRLLSVAALAALGVAMPAQAVLIYGVTTQNRLFSFDSGSPSDLNSGVAITGIGPNEYILGIDFRPSDLNGDNVNDVGRLYGLGSSNQLYTIDPVTGVATAVGGPLSMPLNGTEFGFDFNPTIDRIRVVSDTDQNFVLNPNTGALQLAATNLFYAPGDPNFGVNPSIVGSAYTNNFPGATSTQLYGIDSVLDTLVRQANNAGTLNTVGPLGFDLSSLVGFDITPDNRAFMIATNGAMETGMLYSVDLNTGAATALGQVDGGLFIRAMAVAVPEPATLATVMGVAALGLIRRR